MQPQSSPQVMPFDTASSGGGDFFEQILSSVIDNSSSAYSWPHISNPNPNVGAEGEAPENGVRRFRFDDDQDDRSSPFLTSGGSGGGGGGGGGGGRGLMNHEQMMLSRVLIGNGLNSPAGEQRLLQMPLTLGSADQNDVVDGPSFNSTHPLQGNDTSIHALFNGFAERLGQTDNPSQHLHHPQAEAMQAQNFGGGEGSAAALGNQGVASNGTTGTGTGAQPRQQKVRARRGQATDPHSIAERLRRERIAERMKALQELVPNANKTDKASMLDEIIDYVKFLQLQVKALSMSRLGGAAAVAPLVAGMSAEASRDGGKTNGTRATSPSNNDNITVSEQQVAKLMEDDMGAAMQYLQGKGLCLMPISLASAISTVTGHSRNPINLKNDNGSNNNLMLASSGRNDGRAAATSPSLSISTVTNGVSDAITITSGKDAVSASES